MIILTITKFPGVTYFIARKGDSICSTGDVCVKVFLSEEDFYNKYPQAPSFDEDGVSSWEEGDK